MASSNGGGFVPGFVIGALIGGVAALVLSQEEMRDALLGRAREAGNLAADATGDLRGKVNDAATQWQTGAADLYERGRAVVEGARGALDDAVAQGNDAAERLRQELQRNAGA